MPNAVTSVKSVRLFLWAGGLGLLLFGGCQTQSEIQPSSASIAEYRDRMLVRHQEEVAAQRQRGTAVARPVSWQTELPEKQALMTHPVSLEQLTPEDVLDEVPDPARAPEVYEKRLARLTGAARPDPRVISNYEKVVSRAKENLAAIARPQQAQISLAECIQRALEHNYAIRFEAYYPAISQTQLVEAEAAFDAEFFLDSAWSKLDQATSSLFVVGTSDSRSAEGGFRKLLPTGMQVSTSLRQQRQKTSYPQEVQSLNPAYSTAFIVAFTQPLLRGFGLEYNRAQIKIRQAERDIAYETFIQRVRDKLLEVEQTYWQLVQARREAGVLAETVAQNWVTYKGIQDRITHDATLVELTNAETRWLNRQVEYQEAVKNIHDAEDALKNLLNDPELKLSEDVELVPTETPFIAELALDQLAAVHTALDSRSEIRQARRTIDQARISTAAAKNQTLPQLDLSFQYEVQGMGPSADSSFDNLTTNRFISYTVQAQFSYPLGNRGPRAAHRRARLQESQSLVALHQVTDTIVQEVNAAVRALSVRHRQIRPQLAAVRAAESNLRAYQARTQRVDPLYLENELSSVERLAQTRTTLLRVVVGYNVALAALEKSKGTLLDYNNVVVTDEPPER